MVVIYSTFKSDVSTVGKNDVKAESSDNAFWKPISNPVYPIPTHEPKFVKEIRPVDSAVNTINEIKELWKTVVETAKATYSRTYAKLSNPLSIDTRRYLIAHKEKFCVFDRYEGKWLFNTDKSVDYSFCFDGKDFLSFEELTDVPVNASSKDRLLLCGKFTVLMQEPNLISSNADASSLYGDFNLPEIDMIVGVPGCGKTTFILK